MSRMLSSYFQLQRFLDQRKRLFSFNIYAFILSTIFCIVSFSSLLLVHAKPMKVFFAGDLFNHKDLIGNIYLADAIRNLSNGKYEFFLAQNKVQQKVTHKHIKDQDLKGLMNSDIALFAFDGTELDSGTVVEFVAAKFLDKPSVVYRTDFRGGSGEEDSTTKLNDKMQRPNKWNLMVSFYPRTRVLYLNAMVEYQKVLSEVNDQSHTIIAQEYANNIARHIIKEMEHVLKETPLISMEGDEKSFIDQRFSTLMGIDK